MIKAIAAAGMALAGLGAIGFAQTGGGDDFEALPGGWHMHPSTCTVHHEEGERLVAITYSGMTADFEITSRELGDLAASGVTDLDLAIDGNWQTIPYPQTYQYDDARVGYRFGLEREIFDALRAGRSLELRSGGRTVFAFDLADIAPAVDATTNCYMAGAGVPADAEWGDNSIDDNMM